MRNSLPVILAVTLTWTGPGSLSVRADSPALPSVTGQGTCEVKRQPEYLRVQVDVLAKGKSIQEALAKLRERRQAAQKQLESVGFAAGAIEFGEPVVATEKNDRDRRMHFMMMQQMRQLGKKPAQKPKEAPPVQVSCSLKADLRLPSTNADELLIASHGLEERLKAADLGGLKDLKQASPQDEELAQEEAAEMMDMNEEGPKRGEPVFLYVSKVSNDEEARATGEAFKRARSHAQRLARAAGAELGKLYHLEDTSQMVPDMDEQVMMYSSSSRILQELIDRGRTRGAGPDKAGAEAVGLRPAKVFYRVALTASFELKPSANK